ncbi:MAG: PEP-CTERM sorting domain-containing protein [Isosphaeraceae bacterium]
MTGATYTRLTGIDNNRDLAGYDHVSSINGPANTRFIALALSAAAPEPASLGLLATGLLVLAAHVWRHRRAAAPGPEPPRYRGGPSQALSTRTGVAVISADCAARLRGPDDHAALRRLLVGAQARIPRHPPPSGRRRSEAPADRPDPPGGRKGDVDFSRAKRKSNTCHRIRAAARRTLKNSKSLASSGI